MIYTKITDCRRQLKVGDVVRVDFPWSSVNPEWRGVKQYFGVVACLPSNRTGAIVRELKLHPGDSDVRYVKLRGAELWLVDPKAWPPGVKAMYMKFLHTKVIDAPPV